MLQTNSGVQQLSAKVRIVEAATKCRWLPPRAYCTLYTFVRSMLDLPHFTVRFLRSNLWTLAHWRVQL